MQGEWCGEERQGAERGRQERKVRKSLVVEARSIEQVYEVLSGLLDGVESAERTMRLLEDGRCRREEMERIKRRYERRTGEQLMLECSSEPPSVERGRVAVISSRRPGEVAFGVVVHAFEFDSRLAEYLWTSGIPFAEIGGGCGSATSDERIVDTAFGAVELAAPRLYELWPGAAVYSGSKSADM